MKKLFILCLILFWTKSIAQQKEGRLPLPTNYRGTTKPSLITDTTAVNIKFNKQVFPKQITPKVKYVEKDHEELEEPIPKDVLDRINLLEKKKASILKLKRERRIKNNESNQSETNTSYLINEGSAGCPPDNSVAISRNGFIVSADNSQIGFYKEDGSTLNEFSYPDFLGISDETADPKVVYDYEADRFVFFIQLNSRDNAKSECLLAFSQEEDPTAGWNIYIFHHFRDKDPCWFDYPGLAYNEEEVFLTGNLFNGKNENVIFQFDKDDGYRGRDMNGLMWLNIKQPGNDRMASTIFPLQTIPAWFYERDMLFASIQSGGGGNCYYYRINNRINRSPELRKYEIDIPDYEPPTKVNQKDTDVQLNAGFVKIRGGLFVDNRIYFVFTKPDKDGFNGIAFTRIKIEDFAVKTKFFHDNQNSEYTYPNLAHIGRNKDSHQMLLVYQRSGIDHQPQIRMRKIRSNMSADGNSTTLQSSESFRKECGSGDRGTRWGDYIGIQRKGTANRCWVAGHTANKNNVWRSHLIKVEL
jgi:hypothetical protein